MHNSDDDVIEDLDKNAEFQRPNKQQEKPQAEEKTADRSDEVPRRQSFLRRRPLLIMLAAVALIAAAIAGYLWWVEASKFETTDDAFIQARFFIVSPKVSGYIVNVPVTDNQQVKAGATLTIIDDRDYGTALAQAEAQLAQAQASIPNIDAQIAAQVAQISEAQAQISDADAALKFAQEENNRYQDLQKTGAGTIQRAQQSQSQLTQSEAALARVKAALNAAEKQLGALKAQRISADANIAQSKAQVDQAKLNIDYTTVKAAQGGRVTRLTAAKGQLVQVGQSLMTIVPEPIWVTANYRETQITDMRPGQKVDISVDAYPGKKFTGRLDSIQAGSGAAFSLLPPENATGNYVKVVQRVPVKIVFDHVPADVVLGPGMSVVPSVRVK